MAIYGASNLMAFVAVAAIVLLMFSTLASAHQPGIKLGMLLLVSQLYPYSFPSFIYLFIYIFGFYTVQGENYSKLSYHLLMVHILVVEDIPQSLVVEDIPQDHEEREKPMPKSSLCLKYCTSVMASFFNSLFHTSHKSK